MQTDYLIVGSGCSGLYCALHLPRDKRVTVITKSDVESSDSFLAQGGICVLKDESDFDSFFEDTLKAGHYQNDRESVKIMINSSRDAINDLVSYGVDFSKNENGEFNYTREGAHSTSRILFHHDITGKEITQKLLAEARRRDNIEILEHTVLLDIITDGNECLGGILALPNGETVALMAEYTVLASGGIGGLYRHSTNFRHLTGDAIAIAIKHGVALKNVNYVQIHPTTLYSKVESDRSFLISESVRGEGAKLYGKNMERFVDELLPRDKVTAAIRAQMKKDGSEFVWEDLRDISDEDIKTHFPNIAEYCKSQNYDVTKECIPVVPAQHYFMGGIKVDHQSKTTMERLYAVGETACNGVHGKNRLASNSLLESLVFAKRAAQEMKAFPQDIKPMPEVDLSVYADRETLFATYRKMVLDEINRMNKMQEIKMFDNATLKLKVDPLILGALNEDITSEDVSTNSVMPTATLGEVDLICKEDGILCGIQVFERVFKLLDENTEVIAYAADGDKIEKGELIARVRGDIRVLLSGERTALNYLQRMSGIATYTHQVASLLEGSKTTLLDTRKTTPNNRIFEKYAVRVGGGSNHRYNLSDEVLLKDTHI